MCIDECVSAATGATSLSMSIEPIATSPVSHRVLARSFVAVHGLMIMPTWPLHSTVGSLT